MKFLVSIPAEKVNDERWTTERMPVVPCFPSQHSGAFLTVPGFTLADKAEVSETDADADDLAGALATEYPGLPRRLHEGYILAVYKAVYDVPVGTVYRAIVNQKQAMLVDAKTGASTMLWEKQPM